MLTPWRRLPRALLPTLPSRRLISDARPFHEHDHVVLRPIRDPSASPLLRGPLKAGKKIETNKGVVLHDDIIGKRVRDNVATAPLRSGRPSSHFRLYHVKLEEYVRLSRRLVTPIYPADANSIVSLLDLNPDVYNGEVEDAAVEKLEILEAGTGHGALTLYLSRAIHAANPAKPTREAAVDEGESEVERDGKAEKFIADMTSWRARRRAIIHTTDIAHQYSSHAQATVRAFRQGLYADNIDFHIGDVGAWLAATLPSRGDRPFLSAAFLDMPNADAQLAATARAMRVDATLVVFNPSITQIIDCAKRIKEEGVPLELETVVELGVNGGSGGREWDVRPVRPRAALKKAGVETVETDGEDGGDGDVATDGDGSTTPGDGGSEDSSSSSTTGSPTESRRASEPESAGEWKMICRPKVGDRVVGGGFLGVWKKQRV